MNHFWRWARDETATESEGRELYFEGVIADESWYDDDITPAAFKSELYADVGPVTLVINSPGGDTIAASEIYTMLKDYPYPVTAKITGIAASAASVVAMAGDTVCMSPTSMLMIHNPYTCAMGDSEEMRKAMQLLDEVKASIINAYQIKTGLSRSKISHMMDDETWMNPVKAKELGFCDEILYQGVVGEPDPAEQGESMFFSSALVQRRVMNSILAKAGARRPRKNEPEPEPAPSDDAAAPDAPAAEPPVEDAPQDDATPDDAAPGIPEPGPEPAGAGTTVNTDAPDAPVSKPAIADGPEQPDADAPDNKISADSLFLRLNRLKYNF